MNDAMQLSGDTMAHGKRRILVVDDARNIRRAFCQMLEFSGYETIEASTGEDALEKVDHENVALTLMDVVMPGMSGIEATRRIKSKHREHPVILMSGYVGAQSDSALPSGVRTVLRKPIEVNTLLEAVEREIAESTV
jgi:two-component system cell cycle response regulator DivK